MKFWRVLFLILAFGTARADAYDPAAGTVELHSHIFMDQGLGLMFHGKFTGPIEATSWKDRFSEQTNADAVNRSGVAILVVALYALPGFVWSMKDAIRHQMDTAEQFVKDNPQWVIARSPDDATQILAQGKRALIFSLENAHGVLDSEDDLKEFVDERGIRIVTFMHLMDNSYGGAAYLQGYHVFSNIWSWLFGMFDPDIESDGDRVNPRGLEPKGKEMLARLLAHHVWIDLSHSSDATKNDVIPILQAQNQPLLYTHAPLRKYYGAERGITEDQIKQVKESGGIIGVVPSDEMLVNTKVDPRFCGKGCPASCDSGAHALAQQYSEMVALMGSADRVMFGSDYNGGIPHLSPRCGTGTSLDRDGLWTMSQVPEVWEALRALGGPVPASPQGSREAFISVWGQAFSHSN